MVNQFAEIDQVLEKAFVLAYFIDGDKESARRIVVAAVTKLQVATAAQNKRRYYIPRGRSLSERASPDGFRNKVSFGQMHLLQRLIYIESEPYELQKEREQGANALHQKDMLVHFIKHLVRIGLKRNSFYVTLGLSRLLHDYSTAETMEIYNLVVQDPGRVKDDYYYRSRKAVLLHELKERFGDLLSTQRGPRGEERLRTETASEGYAAMVAECLSFFVPWSTPCPVPADFDPLTESIPLLSYQGQRKEDATEINRIHAILHPGCYRRLILALGLNAPDKRLAVPHFFLRHDESDPDGPRSNSSARLKPSEEDLHAIKSALAEEANRRRKIAPRLLRVLVDGNERALLDLKLARRISFLLEGTPELIEVHGSDVAGEVLLASHLIAYDEMKTPSPPLKTSVVTAHNKKISIDISFSHSASGEVAVGQVEVSYEARNILGALALSAGRLRQALTPRVDRGDGFGALSPKPILLLLLLVAGVAGLIWYARSRARFAPTSVTRNRESGTPSPAKQIVNPEADQQARVNPSASPGRVKSITPPPVDKLSRRSPNDVPQSPEERLVRHPANDEHPGGNQSSTSESDPTRSLEGALAAVSLLEVRKVYVEVTGEQRLAGEFREGLIQHLRERNRFVLTDNRNDADAVLGVSIKHANAGSISSLRATGLKRVFVSARLVNARGDVLWRQRPGAYSAGEVSRMTEQVAGNLFDEIERLQRKH